MSRLAEGCSSGLLVHDQQLDPKLFCGYTNVAMGLAAPPLSGSPSRSRPLSCSQHKPWHLPGHTPAHMIHAGATRQAQLCVTGMTTTATTTLPNVDM
jgi:hypothetical protein